MLMTNVTHVALLLGGSFFFLELAVGTIWAIPMDISREYAGLAGGIMNFGFGLAGIISPVVFGFVVDRTGSWDIPFQLSVARAMLTIFMRPERLSFCHRIEYVRAYRKHGPGRQEEMETARY
jgi:MFS family permease